MMTFESDADNGVIIFTVDGGVTGEEYQAGITAMDGLIALHGKIAVLAVVRSFSGMDLAAWWKDLSWGAGHVGKIRRAGVVTDSDWIKGATQMGAHLVPAEVRVFPLAELGAARQWVAVSA